MTNTDRNRRIYAITVFLILTVCYAYFMPKWGDWNANSRADLVYAVVDSGVLHIDDYHENTGDKACYPGPYDLESDTCEGHYYTDKSIGPSLVALPFYAAFRLVAQTRLSRISSTAATCPATSPRRLTRKVEGRWPKAFTRVWP